MTEDEVKRRREIEREYNVADQMVTAYSVLRDRYALRAVALTLLIFLASVILCTATFLPDTALQGIGITGTAERVLVGVCSSLILFTSIAELCLRWREKSQSYSDAADKLATLKKDLREALLLYESIGGAQCAEIMRSFKLAMDGVPRIPDSQFIGLKAYHLKKVHLSRMCEQAVGCPVWILRCRVFLGGIRIASAGRRSKDNES